MLDCYKRSETKAVSVPLSLAVDPVASDIQSSGKKNCGRLLASGSNIMSEPPKCSRS